MLLQNDQERPQLASHSECTACFACVDACGKNALKAYMGCDGHVYIAVDENKCIGCKSWSGYVGQVKKIMEPIN
mgnify:CR=1 FL=1